LSIQLEAREMAVAVGAAEPRGTAFVYSALGCALTPAAPVQLKSRRQRTLRGFTHVTGAGARLLPRNVRKQCLCTFLVSRSLLCCRQHSTHSGMTQTILRRDDEEREMTPTSSRSQSGTDLATRSPAEEYTLTHLSDNVVLYFSEPDDL
jgi:hypothetical protein